MKRAHVNYARREVDAMPWPDVLPDPAGDLEREYELLRRDRDAWRLVALILACVLVAAAAWALGF